MIRGRQSAPSRVLGAVSSAAISLNMYRINVDCKCMSVCECEWYECLFICMCVCPHIQLKAEFRYRSASYPPIAAAKGAKGVPLDSVDNMAIKATPSRNDCHVQRYLNICWFFFLNFGCDQSSVAPVARTWNFAACHAHPNPPSARSDSRAFIHFNLCNCWPTTATATALELPTLFEFLVSLIDVVHTHTHRHTLVQTEAEAEAHAQLLALNRNGPNLWKASAKPPTQKSLGMGTAPRVGMEMGMRACICVSVCGRCSTLACIRMYNHTYINMPVRAY